MPAWTFIRRGGPLCNEKAKRRVRSRKWNAAIGLREKGS